ncbi:MAG: 50S ribosomal protein L13 [Candidatus Harrisonbacteria bacterium RIFCSPLOWO2_02_FULL_41_11]|uniref:50S ribosomal protein L13 n=1 Tax=Candidatus Harrisonbacteria bacterium RIFCSPHIGHO2_02_FULL_42_16 TaxID=1798404 RepID=A0A1G1ZL35_9BACT|nr:MAG: 50S ribosomal protein L13 [Candidatus Harrisonbacteria bacterium RIFCSPHIGHO2_02_FULL_42_16]OGY66533.1 MAG: 50S ribosomal protein L13 [Candidatus Harrisonbacteria bacterium RIFCSPLOWO2_02_FULL_41_11]
MADYNIDATNKKLGRLSSEVALILQDKKNPSYEPRLAGRDKVIVENLKKLAFSGKKIYQKNYYRHTGYVGHVKAITLKDAFEKNPEKVFRHSVEMMLPKNRLLTNRLKRLILK